LAILLLSIVGCGGGGGGGGGGTTPPTTKTATLKYYTQSLNLSDQYRGYDLKVTLPIGAVIPTDANGVPLAGYVFSSGKFALPPLPDGTSSTYINANYDSASRNLIVQGISFVDINIGEFITVLVSVPVNYDPNPNEVVTDLYSARDSRGIQIPAISVVKSFN